MSHPFAAARPRRFLLAAVTGLVIAPAAYADDVSAPAEVLYGATRNGGGASTSSLYVIDPVTGASTLVGDIGYAINGLAWDPVTEQLLATTTTHASSSRVIRIDPATGAGTIMYPDADNSSAPYHLSTITVAPDGTIRAWADGDDGLAKLDRETGIVSGLGASGLSTYGHSLAYTREGMLFFINGPEGASNVPTAYLVNPDTGEVSLLGDLSGLPPTSDSGPAIAHHGTVGSDGNLYALGGIWPSDAGPRTVQVISLTGGEMLSSFEVSDLDYLHVLAWGMEALLKGLDAGLSFETARALAESSVQAMRNRNAMVVSAMSRELGVQRAAPAGTESLSSMGGAARAPMALRVEGVFGDDAAQGAKRQASLSAAVEIAPGVEAGAFLSRGAGQTTGEAVRFGSDLVSFGGYLRHNADGEGLTWKVMAGASSGTATLSRSGALADLDAGLVENGTGEAGIETRALGLEIGRRIALDGGARIMPYAGLTFARTTRDAYVETGGTDSPLGFDAFTQDQSTLTLGFASAHPLSDRAVLRLGGGVEHDLHVSDRAMTGTSGIAGLETFAVDVSDVADPTRAFLSVGLSMGLGNGGTLSLDAGLRESAERGEVIRTVAVGYEFRF